ncbi:MAG: hypothetical protein IKA19_03395 [Muribaculaceae bacterium]|nr:hypothetical protein [Muribaculaceae bacterium]
MKWHNWILFILLIVASSCKDEQSEPGNVDEVDDVFIGNMCNLFFTEGLEGFDEEKAELYIQAPDGSIIKREIKHDRKSGTSELKLHKGLKDGTYRLLYLQYALENPQNNGKITHGRFGLGCKISVSGINFTIDDLYDKEMELYGEGTEKNPYIIASDYNLRTLAKKVNDSRYNGRITNSTYFKQYGAEIDLEDISFNCDNKQGWSPIGTGQTVPFRGQYDGNNIPIKGLDITRYEDSGVGLFGYVQGGVIKNVTIKKSIIRGNIAVGSLIGTIASGGGVRSSTIVDSCRVETGVKVIGTEEKGGLSTGGLIGCVDMYATAVVNSCATSSDVEISSCYNAGGIIGSTGIYTSVIVSNCVNKASVTSQYSGCGGIIASGDTITMTSCKNYGNITGAIAYTGAEQTAGIGTGGLIGGSGVSTIASSVNYGTVKGKEGVGGIIGSTRITGNDTDGYTYNNTMVIYCGNEGSVEGDVAVGGVCGEAQFGAFGAYNTGTIVGESYTAGIAGCTSVGVIYNSVNAGLINGGTYTSGIVGKTNMGSLAINHNYGIIDGKGSHAGGIVGLGSNCTMINYCGNHGTIKSSSGESVGGIVGEIGDPSNWTLKNTANCILGTIEITMGIIGPAFAMYELKGGKVPKAILCMENGVNIVCGFIDTAMLTWDIYNMATGESIKDSTKSDAEENKNTLNYIRATHGNITLNSFYSGAFSEDYLNNVNALTDYFVASEDNADNYNDNINEARNKRAEQLETYSLAKDIVHATIAGVCIIAGAVATIGGMIVTGGTSTAMTLAVVGGVASMAGGANTIWKTCTDYEENAVIISQCVNTGDIDVDGDQNKNVGGLVGTLHDFSIISNCLNAGACINSIGGGHFAGETKEKTEVLNCLTIADVNSWNDLLGKTPSSGSYTVENLYYYISEGNQSSVFEQSISGGKTGLTINELGQENNYNGWDFSSRWIIPDAAGAFPIPYKSEYQ